MTTQTSLRTLRKRVDFLTRLLQDEIHPDIRDIAHRRLEDLGIDAGTWLVLSRRDRIEVLEESGYPLRPNQSNPNWLGYSDVKKRKKYSASMTTFLQHAQQRTTGATGAGLVWKLGEQTLEAFDNKHAILGITFTWETPKMPKIGVGYVDDHGNRLPKKLSKKGYITDQEQIRKFFVRLREHPEYGPRLVAYAAVREKGGRKGRLHWHAIVFFTDLDHETIRDRHAIVQAHIWPEGEESEHMRRLDETRNIMVLAHLWPFGRFHSAALRISRTDYWGISRHGLAWPEVSPGVYLAISHILITGAYIGKHQSKSRVTPSHGLLKSKGLGMGRLKQLVRELPRHLLRPASEANFWWSCMNIPGNISLLDLPISDISRLVKNERERRALEQKPELVKRLRPSDRPNPYKVLDELLQEGGVDPAKAPPEPEHPAFKQFAFHYRNTRTKNNEGERIAPENVQGALRVAFTQVYHPRWYSSEKRLTEALQRFAPIAHDWDQGMLKELHRK